MSRTNDPVETNPEHVEIQLTKQMPIERLRDTRRSTPSTSNNINGVGGEKINIKFSDAQHVLDFAHSYLLFKIKGGIGTAGTGNSRFSNFAASVWIRSLRIMSAGRTLEYIRDYNVHHRQRGQLLFSQEYKDSIYGKAMQGIGSTSDLEGWFTNGQQFALQPFGFLASPKYLPLPLMSDLEIEIELEDPDRVIVFPTDGADPTYTVEYIRYMKDLVKLSDTVMKKMVMDSETKGVVYHYSAYHSQQKSIPTTTSDSIQLGTVQGAVKDVKFFQILAADRDGNNEEYIPSFKQNLLKEYNIRLGDSDLRQDHVRVDNNQSAEYIVEFLKSEHLYPLISIGAADLTDNTVNFVVGQQVDVSRNPDTLNSVEERFNNSVELDVEYTSAPAAGLIYVAIHVDRTLTFTAGRRVRIE